MASGVLSARLAFIRYQRRTRSAAQRRPSTSISSGVGGVFRDGGVLRPCAPGYPSQDSQSKCICPWRNGTSISNLMEDCRVRPISMCWCIPCKQPWRCGCHSVSRIPTGLRRRPGREILLSMFPAARATDMHVCPMLTVLVPHVGGPILPPCAVTVLTGGLPQARVTDMATCVGPPDVIVLGSFTVLVCGLPAAENRRLRFSH